MRQPCDKKKKKESVRVEIRQLLKIEDEGRDFPHRKNTFMTPFLWIHRILNDVWLALARLWLPLLAFGLPLAASASSGSRLFFDKKNNKIVTQGLTTSLPVCHLLQREPLHVQQVGSVNYASRFFSNHELTEQLYISLRRSACAWEIKDPHVVLVFKKTN